MNLLKLLGNAWVDMRQRSKNRAEFRFNCNPVVHYQGVRYACTHDIKGSESDNCTGNCNKCDYGIPVYGVEKEKLLEAEEERRYRAENRRH
jgi:hypothetical protein